MPDFSLSGLIDPFKNAQREIGDDALPDKEPVLNISGDHDFKFEVSNFEFSVKPLAGARLYVLNNPAKDSDEMRVLGHGKVKEDDANLDHQIDFTDNGAWAKYEIEAGLSASAGGNLVADILNLKGQASKRVLLYDYHHHSDRKTKVQDAIAEDLQSFRFAVHEGSLDALEAQEAIAYRVPGRLSLTLEASFTDAFIANLGGLLNFLKVGGLIGLKVSAGAVLKFSVELSDDFILILTKASNGNLRLAAKKAKQSKLGIGGSLGVSAKLVDTSDNQDALEKLIEEVIGALGDAALEKIEGLLAKADFDNLNEDEQSLLERLIERFGLGEEAKRAEKFKELWGKLADEIKKTVTKTVENKISLAFEFEYLRIKSEETVLDAILPSDVVKGHYGSLLRRELTDLLAWMRQNPGQCKLNKYLHQRKLSTSSKWGLTFGLGKWLYGGGDKREFEEVVQTTFDERQRVSFRRRRGYQATEFKNSLNYMVDLSAHMREFSAHPNPLGSEFKKTLKMEWTWKEAELSKDEVEAYFDHAAIWGVIGADDSSKIEGDLGDLTGKTAEVSLHIAAGEELCQELFPYLAVYHVDRIARCLALATPRWSELPARNFIERREAVYAPLWKKYLQESDDDPKRLQPRDWAKEAYRRLKKEGIQGDLLERNAANFEAFSEVIRLNADEGQSNYSGTQRRWRGFSNAMLRLNAAQSQEKVKQALRDTDPLWDHPFHVRAFGAFVVKTARQQGLLSKLERTLTFKIPGQEKDLVYGRKA